MTKYNEHNEAEATLWRAEAVANEMAKIDKNLEHGFARLGYLLLEISQMGYWRVTHTRIKDYLTDLAPHANRSVAQLQRYFLTVRDLIDVFDEQQIENMGITKAMKVRQARDYALVLPKQIVDAALDPAVTATQLKRLIGKTLKAPESDESNWMDCEMEFEVTPEERTFLEETFDIARRTEPLTKSTIAPSAQMKDIMMKLCMEFRGAHTGDGQ